MIKAKGQHAVLRISEEGMRRLREGQPITIDLGEMCPGTVLIFDGTIQGSILIQTIEAA
jgi:hypothetical protein